MKKILLLITLFFPVYIYAQNGINISFLRTGLDVDTLSEITGKKIKSTTEAFYYGKDLVELAEGEPKKESGYLDIYYRKQFVNGYRIFKVNHFKVNDIEFINVEMIFHEGKLISFKSEFDLKVKEVLTFKYQDPVTNIKQDSVHCTYKLTGNVVTYETYTARYEWTVGESKAILLIGNYYNDKCEKKYLSLFNLEDIDEKKTYVAEVKKREELLQSERDSIKKEDLSRY